MQFPLNGSDVLDWNGVQYKMLMEAASSDGNIAIVDGFSPIGSGPPRHVHDAEDETFVLLEGALDFYLDGEVFRKQPGESVFIPRGREHTFQTTSQAPSRHLVILTPGGFENFFKEMAQGKFAIPDHMEQIAESAERHNCRFTGPPLEVKD